jgi:uncharacterized lipoprotein
MLNRNHEFVVNIYTAYLGVLLFLPGLSGCALSPQIIEVNPDIQLTDTPAVTRPLTLGLNVIDSRNSPVLGQRGGVYKDTSDISTSENMTRNLHRQITVTLKGLGYNVANKGEPSDADLAVSVTDMKYIAHSEKLLNKIEIRAGIKVSCRKNGKEFTGDYSATRKKDYVKLPSIEENEKIVNEAMAIILQSMLQDQDLISFLQG